jgi:response regulator RpfG family c-di-GMP phosphodiesterase
MSLGAVTPKSVAGSSDQTTTVVLQPQVQFTNARSLLKDLLDASLIRTRDWKLLPGSVQTELANCSELQKLLQLLIQHHMLTEYQAHRITTGKTFGMVLGNYQILEILGAGGMGIVFKGKHIRLPRTVAIKVFSGGYDDKPYLLERFFAEIWTVAELQHPNIVKAIDAGTERCIDGTSSPLYYFVMEYVAGEDLEAKVNNHGPLSPAQGCDLIYQLASALDAAHKHQLVHRDIKPSNIMVTPEGQAMLLDFGIVRQFGNRFTESGSVLGTLDYIAPEQARDAASVDIRADIYSLGATFFWSLTGRKPFPSAEHGMLSVLNRLHQPPPLPSTHAQNVAKELDEVIMKMMATDRNERFATPQILMRALFPFLKTHEQFTLSAASQSEFLNKSTIEVLQHQRTHHVLVVDDEEAVRQLCCSVLMAEGIECAEANNGRLAWQSLQRNRFDLVLSDIDMPEMRGPELLRQVRLVPPSPHLKMIMVSGRASADEMAQLLLAGADDYLSKPLSIVQLLSRIKTALHLKDAQDRSDLLTQHLLSVNHDLEENLTSKDSELLSARNALVLGLAELVAYRDMESLEHLQRTQRSCVLLAELAAGAARFREQLHQNYVHLLQCCAPLHDIGKAALPDHILTKVGKLEGDERLIMQTHTTIGAEMLDRAYQRHGFSAAFYQMAHDLVKHHHERYDGTGYPDRLAGENIPLAARIFALVDTYDSLRARQPYKPALTHDVALQILTETSPGQFDPQLLEIFQQNAERLRDVVQM